MEKESQRRKEVARKVQKSEANKRNNNNNKDFILRG